MSRAPRRSLLGIKYGNQQNGAAGQTWQSFMDYAASEAIAAAAALLKPAATLNVGTSVTMNDTKATVIGHAGQNVVDVQDVVLNGATATIDSPPNSSFVIRVHGKLSLNGASSIALAGGISPDKVLFDVIGSGQDVALTGKSTLAGIVLALSRNVSLSSGIVSGEVIAGGQQLAITSGGQINGWCGCNDATPAPTTAPSRAHRDADPEADALADPGPHADAEADADRLTGADADADRDAVPLHAAADADPRRNAGPDPDADARTDADADSDPVRDEPPGVDRRAERPGADQPDDARRLLSLPSASGSGGIAVGHRGTAAWAFRRQRRVRHAAAAHRYGERRAATASISTRAPRGSAATATVERAGVAPDSNDSPYTALTAAKSFMSARKIVVLTTSPKVSPPAASTAARFAIT